MTTSFPTDEELNEFLKEFAEELIDKYPGDWMVQSFRINRTIPKLHFKTPLIRDQEGNIKIGFTYWADPLDGTTYMDGLWVHEELQGQGIGKELVEFRERLCQELSLKTIIVTDCVNIPFWEHMGYKPVTYQLRKKFPCKTNTSSYFKEI